MLNFLSAVVYNVLTDLHKWKQSIPWKYNIPSKRRPFYMKFRWDKKYLYWGITALLVIGASICLFFLMFRGANFKDGVAQIISIANSTDIAVCGSYYLRIQLRSAPAAVQEHSEYCVPIPRLCK